MSADTKIEYAVFAKSYSGEYIYYEYEDRSEAEESYQEWLDCGRNAFLCIVVEGKYYGQKVQSRGLPLELQPSEELDKHLERMQEDYA